MIESNKIIEDHLDPQIIDPEEFIENIPMEYILTAPKSVIRQGEVNFEYNYSAIVWFREKYPDIDENYKIDDFSVIEEIAMRYLQGNRGTFGLDVPVTFTLRKKSRNSRGETEYITRTEKTTINETPIHKIMMQAAGEKVNFETACKLIVKKAREREGKVTVEAMTTQTNTEITHLAAAE